ncbi:MAG: CHAD domain-containing protein [Thermoguttaceae bacterium]|jgi:CHAD domain-containing protein
MIEQELLEAEPTAIPPDSKWIGGISPDQPVCEVAGRVLDARLKAVYHVLPLAAEKSDEDVEHVHQLRISVRRAVEAVRVFSGLMEEAEIAALRDRLRRIRLAADEARNWDVMCERFSQGSREEITARIVEQIKSQRREAQVPMFAVYKETIGDACEAKIEKLVEEIESHRNGEGKRRFGRQVHRYLNPVVKKFFKAAESDLTTDEALHALRIRTKKLRYTMEIVAVAFDSAFRALYRQVSLFQDLLGTVNDHATAKTLFRDWLSKFEDAEQKAFLEGLLLAEERATKDLQAAFLSTWTPKVVSGLKQDFRAYC